MKKEKPSVGGDNLNAFLGEGTSFKGSLSFEGTVRIDGNLEGDVSTKGTLVIGRTSSVRATVRAGNVIVNGTLHGDITAEKKVELHPDARLIGNISTPSLNIADGVIFEGSCTMGHRKERSGTASGPVAPVPQPQKVLS